MNVRQRSDESVCVFEGTMYTLRQLIRRLQRMLQTAKYENVLKVIEAIEEMLPLGTYLNLRDCSLELDIDGTLSKQSVEDLLKIAIERERRDRSIEAKILVLMTLQPNEWLPMGLLPWKELSQLLPSLPMLPQEEFFQSFPICALSICYHYPSMSLKDVFQHFGREYEHVETADWKTLVSCLLPFVPNSLLGLVFSKSPNTIGRLRKAKEL